MLFVPTWITTVFAVFILSVVEIDFLIVGTLPGWDIILTLILSLESLAALRIIVIELLNTKTEFDLSPILGLGVLVIRHSLFLLISLVVWGLSLFVLALVECCQD